MLGAAVRRVYDQDGPSLKQNGMDFVASFIFGGQIAGEAMRLFLVYSAGNFIEATRETCFFQIGESKYGKPILDRVLTPTTPLEEAAKCALVSMDSTMKSNLSVGLPLDLAVYEQGRLESDKITCIDADNPYFRMVRDTWGQRLREVFEHGRPALGRCTQQLRVADATSDAQDHDREKISDRRFALRTSPNGSHNPHAESESRRAGWATRRPAPARITHTASISDRATRTRLPTGFQRRRAIDPPCSDGLPPSGWRAMQAGWVPR